MPKDNQPNTPRQDIVAFLNEIGNVQADRINPAYKSRYASLAEILDTVKTVAAKHNLCVHQRIDTSEGQLRVSTYILHGSTEGSMDCGTIAIKSEGLDAQKLGSALTYLRRQALQTACGISTDIDDDGAKASGPAVGRGNYQREDDRRTTKDVWFSFIPQDKLPKAKEYLVAKGWLAADAAIETLGNQHQMVIAENQSAFLKAISK